MSTVIKRFTWGLFSVGMGWALHQTYDRYGPSITLVAGGVVATLALALLLISVLVRDAALERQRRAWMSEGEKDVRTFHYVMNRITRGRR